MTKKELVSRVVETLRENNTRKPVSSPKHVFHISDDEGNHKDFLVKKTEKTVSYNSNDVLAVINACLSVIEETIKKGEEITIHGFGTLGVHKRAARRAVHPGTGELIDVQARYVPKFSYGNTLKMAAKLYELSLEDFNFSPDSPPVEEADG